jgi:hypothetical protein
MISETGAAAFHRFRFAGGIRVDVCRYVLMAGVSEAMLAAAARRMQVELACEPGFLGRLLVQDGESVYLDLLYWSPEPEELPTLAQRAETSRACAEYLACLAEPPHTRPPVEALIRGVAASSAEAGTKG